MKAKLISASFLFSLSFVFIIFQSCNKKKEEVVTPTPVIVTPVVTDTTKAVTISLPSVITTPTSLATDTTVTAGGNVSSDGGLKVTSKGVCYGTSANPSIAGAKVLSDTGKGSYSVKITSLTPNTTYYLRAFATNSKGTAYGSQVTFKTSGTSLPAISIGNTYQGGIIFYIDGTGKHGLIAAPGDFNTWVSWGCMGTNIAGTSSAIGSGKNNTTLIVNSCTTTNIAASLCYNLDYGGYDDWFLPSKDELALMHTNLHLTGKSNFSGGRYWSSTQYNANNVWVQFFNNNVNQLYYDKVLIDYPVRAARAF